MLNHENLQIQQVTPLEAEEFIEYVNHHLQENGTDRLGYFQPMSRGAGLPEGKAETIRSSLEISVPAAGWRRAWVAREPGREIVGHIDLRGRPEPFTMHRCLLGMGVRQDCRRSGIGSRLLEHATRWAASTDLEWVDLEVLSENKPAVNFYRKHDFAQTAEWTDLFRIDGHSLGSKSMTRKVVR